MISQRLETIALEESFIQLTYPHFYQIYDIGDFEISNKRQICY